MKPSKSSRGYTIAYRREVTLVNPSDRSWTKHDYILWFGACGTTYLRVWSNCLDSALEKAAGWLAEHAPGHLTQPEYSEERNGEGEPVNADEAEADLTYTESGWLVSYEWGIVAEDVTRAGLESLLGAKWGPQDAYR